MDALLAHMRDIQRCEASLRELNHTWRMLETSAKISCPQEARSILPMMTATRTGFQRLERNLISSLVHERLAHVQDELATKAAHVVDIIVRNLYERTADVGFLATDRALCDFVAAATEERDRTVIEQRLLAYRDKYTVYDDILLVDLNGRVLAHIDQTAPVQASHATLIARTLASDSYVETFGPCDLRPGRRQALIYSRRMHDAKGRVCGVLCLSFAFDDEMQGIFRSRSDDVQRAVMLLVDDQQRVIASSDECWVPVGARVPVDRELGSRAMLFSGREYLVRTCEPEEYQGYQGPSGWVGQVMIPLDLAFPSEPNRTLENLDRSIADGLLTHAQVFCPPLHEIIHAAQAIRQVVWNGQLMMASRGEELQRLKPVLEQVSETGARTDALFTNSIRELYGTVLNSALRRGEFTARLLVDLLDRNLYERSDDCRWWALTPELRLALSSRRPDGVLSNERRAAAITPILQGIHQLYTVYSRLVVYDQQGVIVAESRRDEGAGKSLIGHSVEEDCLRDVLALRSPEEYHVSPFRPTPLNNGVATYVYHAPVREPDAVSQVIGGVAIVFDGHREFEAMLRGGLQDTERRCAMFIDRGGVVIASTDPTQPVGACNPHVPAGWLALANGDCASDVIIRNGHYVVASASVSSGYREFKVSDGYRDDVIAVVYEPLGEVRDNTAGFEDAPPVEIHDALTNEPIQAFATFFLNGQLHAVPARQLLEARPASQITRSSVGRHGHRVGMIEYSGTRHELAALTSSAKTHDDGVVWVYDLSGLISGRPIAESADHTVIIVRITDPDTVDGPMHTVGLLVGKLHGVPEFQQSQFVPLPPRMGGATNGAIKQLLEANHGELLIPVFDLHVLLADLIGTGVEPAHAELCN